MNENTFNMWHRLYRFTYVAIDNLGNSSKVAYVIEGRKAGRSLLF